MSTSETITRTDLTNILNEVLPCPAPVTFLGKIASVDFKGTSTSWQYTGMSFTVPVGHRYLVCLYNNWNSGKPIGIGIDYSSTLSVEGYPCYNFENANGFSISPTWTLNAGTYYVFSKRYSVPTLTNNHAVYAWDFHSGVMPVTDLQADYIVEQGTSGIWTYRKWNSGIAECWGENDSTQTFNSWGNLYSTDIVSISYPSGLFISTPICMAATKVGTYNTVSSPNSITGSASETPQLTAIRGTSASGSFTATTKYIARGKWK